MAADLHSRHLTPNKAGGNLGRALFNTGLTELSSPLATAATTALIGKAPYLTRGDDLLQAAPRVKDGQVLSNLRTAAGNMNPLLALLAGTARGHNAPFQAPAYRALNTLGQVSFPVLKKDPPGSKGSGSGIPGIGKL